MYDIFLRVLRSEPARINRVIILQYSHELRHITCANLREYGTTDTSMWFRAWEGSSSPQELGLALFNGTNISFGIIKQEHKERKRDIVAEWDAVP